MLVWKASFSSHHLRMPSSFLGKFGLSGTGSIVLETCKSRPVQRSNPRKCTSGHWLRQFISKFLKRHYTKQVSSIEKSVSRMKALWTTMVHLFVVNATEKGLHQLTINYATLYLPSTHSRAIKKVMQLYDWGTSKNKSKGACPNQGCSLMNNTQLDFFWNKTKKSSHVGSKICWTCWTEYARLSRAALSWG